jgi:hypothetical protein
MSVETAATITEFQAEARIFGLFASLPYYSIENPDQAVVFLSPARVFVGHA